MSVPYTFATATGSLPLSQLDSNFSTAITIGNTAVVLGDTITTVNNLSLANVAITSVSTQFPNGYLANSNVIVGTTTLTLGSTVTTIDGLILGNVTIASGNVTITNVSVTTANATTANVGTLIVRANATVGGNVSVTGNVSMNVATITTANVSGTANVSTLVITANQTSLGNITATGNVTAAKLIPTGSSVTGNGLYLPAANALGLSTNGNNAVYIDSSQNVGIGTSSPSTYGKLAVYSASGASSAVTVNGGTTISDYAQQIVYANAQQYYVQNLVYGNGLCNTAANPAAGQYYSIGTVSSTPLLFNTANTERMRIDSNGNVGIGTASPGVLLDVVGVSGARVKYGAGLGLLLSQTSSAGAVYVNQQANDAMVFATNNTERMRIDSAGNTYIESGLLWQYAPTPTTKAAAATLTAAELATDIITLTGTTYTITLPTGSALDTYYTGVPAVNIGYDFHIVNTASGIITIAVGATGMTSVGLLTVAATVSAHFRLRRTAANTYILYRLS